MKKSNDCVFITNSDLGKMVTVNMTLTNSKEPVFAQYDQIVCLLQIEFASNLNSMYLL